MPDANAPCDSSFGAGGGCARSTVVNEREIYGGGTPMGIGLGVVLVVVGAALMWAINVNISFIDDFTLGLILFIVGIVAIGLSLYLNAQRNRTKHVEERRYEQR
jgi:UDP-N-acetylmuramyl pentapeptide phosphotransferase/UDP-N-acetylglucosamine-1-phosphate transferase